MKQLNLVPMLVTALLINACSGLLPKHEPLDVYRLPVAALTAEPDKPALDWQLRVETPQAPGMLNGTRIAVLPAGDRVSVYQGARWSERVPQLVRDRLIRAFRDNGRLAAISSDDDGLHADFVLGGSLDAFQSEYRGGAATPTVVIRFNAMLVRPSGKHIIATHLFEFAVPSSSTSVADVVTAFGKAGDQLGAAVLSWTYAQAAAHKK